MSYMYFIHNIEEKEQLGLMTNGVNGNYPSKDITKQAIFCLLWWTKLDKINFST